MAKLLSIDFSYEGPFGNRMAEQLSELAHSIAEEPGFMWKIWTEKPNHKKKPAGVYLFADVRNSKGIYRETYLKAESAWNL